MRDHSAGGSLGSYLNDRLTRSQNDLDLADAKVARIQRLFESILCLAGEGPGVTPSVELFEEICREAGKGYELCNELRGKGYASKLKRELG